MNPIVVLIAAGLINFIATLVIVDSFLFKSVRDAGQKFGCWLQRHGWLFAGKHIVYFVTCPLCVGIWIGFAQTLVLPPVFQAPVWISWLINGLLFKGLGHVVYQVNAWFHVRIAFINRETEMLSGDEPEHQPPEAEPKPPAAEPDFDQELAAETA
jgi:hypothetical protein